MNTIGKSSVLVAAILAATLFASAAHAAPFVVTVSQQGGNVVAAGSGAFDLTGLSLVGTQNCLAAGGAVYPGSGSIGLGGSAGSYCDYYSTTGAFNGPASFGSGSATIASSATGDSSFILPNASVTNIPGVGALLLVATGYVSDATLSNTTTWTNASLASLGMTPGTYTWSWGNGADQTFTLDILAAPPPPPPPPAYVVKVFQQGGDVMAVGSGAFDFTGLNAPQQGACSAALTVPFGAAIMLGSSANCDTYAFPTSLPGPTSFGNGSAIFATSGTGDSVGFGGSLASSFVVPNGYVFDALLSGTATWSNATFASLGLTPGTYNWTWGNGTYQSFTVEIGNFATGVPEPSAWALFGGGLLLLGAFLGMRRRMA